MDSLARWIVKHEHPTRRVFVLLLGVYSGIGFFGFAIATIYQALDGESTNALLCLLSMVVLFLLTLPSVRQARQNRERVPLQPLLVANAQGGLASKLGDRAEALEESAADLEQMQMLLPWTTLDESLRSELERSADERMLRMLELTVAPPARYGMTRDQAHRQFAEDGRWMAEARRLVERVREAPERREDPEGLDALVNLRTFVASREEARAELRA